MTGPEALQAVQFVTDTADAAWEWARSEHPDDDGAVVMFVSREKGWRISSHHQ